MALYYAIVVGGEKCSGQNDSIHFAKFEPSILYSPSYPQNYEVNDECIWPIHAVVEGTEYAIQINTVEIDLIDNDPTKNCSFDYLAIFEGDDTNGALLAKWCGSKKRIVKTPFNKITLKFHSDRQYTGKGFVLSYALVKSTPVVCEQQRIPTLEIGRAPVYEVFQGKKSLLRCEWHIQSTDPEKKLVFELHKPSSIKCGCGAFNFYDGQDKKKHVAFTYCSSKEPFSIMYLSSNFASLIFEHNMFEEPDSLILKISARPFIYNCTVSDMPTIEIRRGPAIFSLPFAKNLRGTPCPVRVWAPDRENRLRLDVMGTSEVEADCDTNVVTVVGDRSNVPVTSFCNKKTNLVYQIQGQEGVVVNSKVLSTVFLRAIDVYSMCNGKIIEETAYHSLVQEQTLPKIGGNSPLSQCKLLITAHGDDDVIALTVKWELPKQGNNCSASQVDICPGDYIAVYDGGNDLSPLLLSSCQEKLVHEEKIEEAVYSSQRHIYLVIDTDAHIGGDSFNIKFYSIPGGEICTETREILVNREPKTITSLNYPDVYPRNQRCIQHLTSEEPGDDIVVKVVDAQLGLHCESILIVYNGYYEFTAKKGSEYIARICGTDTPTIRVSSKLISLTTLSEDFTGRGGWKAEVYTVKSNNSADNTAVLNRTMCSLMLAIKLLMYFQTSI